ncbi:hypothetical protein ACWEQC_01890 [Streptomyces shenzhenensis]
MAAECGAGTLDEHGTLVVYVAVRLVQLVAHDHENQRIPLLGRDHDVYREITAPKLRLHQLGCCLGHRWRPLKCDGVQLTIEGVNSATPLFQVVCRCVEAALRESQAESFDFRYLRQKAQVDRSASILVPGFPLNTDLEASAAQGDDSGHTASGERAKDRASGTDQGHN